MEKPWVGVTAAHRDVVARLLRVAPTDAEVLISGPSGVGKELYARYTHEHSRRATKPFVAVNCGSIPGDLVENELFGHVGGAFTGARPSADGLVNEAREGTLFFDEVDALTPRSQVKLLRFVQDKEYRRLGEPRMRRADVRIIAATNADLVHEVAEGRFREDLFFRLRVMPIYVPPLAERREDVQAIFEAYRDFCSQEYRLPSIILGDAARALLLEYHWPGNVRELENCVRYLTLLQLTRPVAPEDLPFLDVLRPPRPPRTLTPTRVRGFRRAKADMINDFERRFLETALDESGGNIAQAARAAGKPRRAFFELMRKHGIHVARRD